MINGVGFDRKRMVNYNTDSFDCTVCSCVAQVPRQCDKCDSFYCCSCITKWLQDKNGEGKGGCCSEQSINTLSTKMQTSYNNLSLRCLKCQNTIKINEIDQHQIECGLIKYCINFQYCGNIIPQDNMNNNANQVICRLILVQRLKLLIFQSSEKYQSQARDIQKVRELLSSNPFSNSCSLISDQEKQNIMNNQITIGNSPIIIRWDRSRSGSYIILTDGDQKVYLEETAFNFKSIVANYGFESGIAYWKIELDERTKSELKIGVTTQRDFKFQSSFSDYEFGWAYYGIGEKRHYQKQNGIPYGKKFKDKGTVGICLNMNLGVLVFSLNGEDLGWAFRDEKLKRGPIYPAVSLLHQAGCKIISDKPLPQIFQQYDQVNTITIQFYWLCQSNIFTHRSSYYTAPLLVGCFCL